MKKEKNQLGTLHTDTLYTYEMRVYGVSTINRCDVSISFRLIFFKKQTKNVTEQDYVSKLWHAYVKIVS